MVGPKGKIKAIIYSLFLVLFVGVSIFVSRGVGRVKASYMQDNNNGYFAIDFLNNQTGIAAEGTPERQNIYIDTQVGVAKLTTGQTNGYFTTVNIEPLSFRRWGNVEIKGNYQNTGDILVSIYDCSDPLKEIIPMTALQGESFDISNIQSNLYKCIRIRVDLVKSGSIEPVVDNIRVNWTKLPVFLISSSSTPTVLSGDNITTVIRYSVSYASDNNVVIYSELPTINNGGITNFEASYNQDLSVNYVKASIGGVYTSTSVIVGEVVVPANSVYWVFSNIEAGKNGLVSYSVKTRNGTQKGVNYNIDSAIDSAIGDIKTSNTSVSTISSKAIPTIDISTVGTLQTGNEIYVYGDLNYSMDIKYVVSVSNSYQSKYLPRNVEELFNPNTSVNLTNIVDFLDNNCGGSFGKIDEISSNGVYDNINKLISWDYNQGIKPQEIVSFSFKVDYSGCPITENIQTTTTLTGDNISPISDSLMINIGISWEPFGTFSLGDRVNGVGEINVFMDDNRTKINTYGDTTSYLLWADNKGFTRLDDIVMMDMIPDGMTYVGMSSPSILKAKYYFNTSDEYAPDEPPTFDYTNPESNGWSSVEPTNKEYIRWVVAYVPCLSSKYFPSPQGSECYGVPTNATVELQVKVNIPSNICEINDIRNTARFWGYNMGANITNDDNVIPTNPVLTLFDDKERSHILPSLADFSSKSSLTGPSNIKPLENAVYNIVVQNTGKDISRNTKVEISVPQINVNGVNKYIDITNVTGGEVDYSELPSKIIVDLEDIPSNVSKKY